MFALDRRGLSGPALALMAGGIAGAMLVLASTRFVSPVIAGVGLCALLGAGVIVLFPALGLLLTAAVVPLERFGRLTSDSSMHTISLMRMTGLLVLACFVLHALSRRWTIRVGEPLVLYGAYCLVAIGTVFYTSDPLGTVRAAGAILGNLAFFFVVINLARSWKLSKAAMLCWLLSTLLIGLYSIYDWHFGGAVDVQRIGELEARFSTVYSDTAEWQELDVIARSVGPTSSAAVYGINLILTLPFLAFLVRVEKSVWRQVLIAGAAAVILYNVLLSNTRAAILLTIAVVLLMAVKKLLVVTGPRLLAAGALVLVAVPFVPAAAIDRVLDPSNYTFSGSTTLRIRMDYWRAGLQIAEENWLTGIGLGNQNEIPRYLKNHAPKTTSVHNEYLQTFTEVGIVGFALFFSFVGTVLWISYRTAALLKGLPDKQHQYWFVVSCQIAMIAVLLYGIQVDVFHFPLKGWWLIAGLTCAMHFMAREWHAEPRLIAADGHRSG